MLRLSKFLDHFKTCAFKDEDGDDVNGCPKTAMIDFHSRQAAPRREENAFAVIRVR